MSSFRFRSLALLAAVAGALSQSAFATVPYTENFTTDTAQWRNGGETASTYVASGGPDGSSYITASASAAGLDPGNSVVVFRGQDAYNSSGDAFTGDWLGSGINHFSVWVRHHASQPLDFFVRFATAANFPGTAADKGVLIPADTWTKLSYDIDSSFIFNATSNPTGYLFPEGPNSFFFRTFSDASPAPNLLGNIQIGYSVPVGFATSSFNFDLDQPSISIETPEPSTLFLATVVGLSTCFRRNRAA